MESRPFRLCVDTALALCNHSLTFRICRCLDAKTSCKNKEGKLFTNKQLLSSTKLLRLNWSGRQNNYNCRFSARAQDSITNSQLRNNNGTDEQGSECYANGRHARVPGGTTPGARCAKPSGYSRRSEEASTLPAARGSDQRSGLRQRHVEHSGGLD
jgi:hypothetical protein